MTDQNDRQDESLVKSAIRPNIVRWSAVIFSPVIVDWLFIAMIENLTKSMSHMACLLFGSSQWVVERQHFYQATQNGEWTAIAFAQSKMHILKSSGFWFHNIITYWVHHGKGTCMQPFGNQLFWFREAFLRIKSPAAKISGAMVTKMVPTWRVGMQKSNQNRNEKQRIVNPTKRS